MSMGAISAFLPVLGWIGDALQLNQAQKKSEALTREGVGRLDDLMGSVNAQDLLESIGMPGVQLGSYTYNPAGSGDVLNLQDMFGTDKSLADTFSGAYGDGYNYDQLYSRAMKDLSTGLVDPSAAARRVGSYLSDVPTAAYQEAGLADIAAGSLAREQAAIQEATARGAARGQTATEREGNVAGLKYGEAVNRASQSANVKAQAENMMRENERTRAGMMSQADMQATGINSALAQAAASMGTNIGMADAAENMQAATLLAQLTGQDIQNADQDQLQMYAALMDAIQRGAWATEKETDTDTQLQMMAAQLLAGIPVGYNPISQAIQSGVSNWMNWKSMENQKSGNSSSFSILGTGFSSSSCVSGRAMIETVDGIKPLAAVQLGDYVKGEDGEYHLVVARDYGTVPETEQNEHLRIQTTESSLVITKDHPIAGVKARLWTRGDRIKVDGRMQTVLEVTPAEYEVSGDLMLEGNVRYLANGFPVDSVIGEHGLDNWNDYCDRLEQAKTGDQENLL